MASYDRRTHARRTPEELAAIRRFELLNFGSTSVPCPNFSTSGNPHPGPETSRRPLPGVYTIPGVTQPAIPRRRTRRGELSDISLPCAPPPTVAGFIQQDVDTTIEFSGDGTLPHRVAEPRNVPITKRACLGDDASWIGRQGGYDQHALGGDISDAEGSVASEESDGEDLWQDVEEGINPAAVMDETGEICEGKRKTYASSVR